MGGRFMLHASNRSKCKHICQVALLFLAYSNLANDETLFLMEYTLTIFFVVSTSVNLKFLRLSCN